jgi:hypothetical protein
MGIGPRSKGRGTSRGVGTMVKFGLSCAGAGEKVASIHKTEKTKDEVFMTRAANVVKLLLELSRQGEVAALNADAASARDAWMGRRLWQSARM